LDHPADDVRFETLRIINPMPHYAHQELEPYALALQEVDKVTGFEITFTLAQGVHRFAATVHSIPFEARVVTCDAHGFFSAWVAVEFLRFSFTFLT
jgi:hypothetical protein